jgi:hypothetical protein
MLDFSQAQMNGFLEAFADAQLIASGITREHVNDPSLATRRHGLLLRAQKLVKGCEVHWERSVKRIAVNTHYVPVGNEDAFRRLCDEMKRSAAESIFWELEQHLRSTYPKITDWLDWWIRPAIRKLIFNPFRVMDPKLNQGLPNSTNPVESIHQSITIATGKGHHLLSGLTALLAIAQRIQRQHAATQGVNTLFDFSDIFYQHHAIFSWLSPHIWKA